MKKIYEVRFTRTYITEVFADSEDEAIERTAGWKVPEDYEAHEDGEPTAEEIGEAEEEE